jgi:hypothetical protein
VNLSASRRSEQADVAGIQKKGEVFEITKDSPKVKPDVTINLSDETFQKLVRLKRR